MKKQKLTVTTKVLTESVTSGTVTVENDKDWSTKQTMETMNVPDGENLSAMDQCKEDKGDKQKVSDLNEVPCRKRYM